MTMWSWVWYTDIALQGDRCIPMVGFPQYSYLLNRKSCWDGSVQIDWDCSNLGQINVQVRYWILLELGKQQRLQLPVLFEAGKTKPPFLEVLPTSVQLFNSLLKNLGRNFTQPSVFLLGFWQVVKLLDFAWKL
jgi:hypothetical protein